MKDLSIYFQSVQVEGSEKEGSVAAKLQIHKENSFPEIESNSIAILSVPEFRNGRFENGAYSDNFRNFLYELHVGDSWTRSLYDLGVIIPGETVEDTHFAVAQTVAELVKNDVIPIVIGGSQDLTLACYKGFESLEQMINICSIDNKLDIGEPSETATGDGYVSHLLMQRPCYLFNYANIGMQRPLVAKKEVDLFDKLYFDVCRLGEFNADFKLAEPYLRNSDLLSIDFGSIRSSDSDTGIYKNPNGLYAEHVCQIAKYAGISDKLACFGIFDVAPQIDSIAGNLLAQIIWYFMDGVSQRVGDFPIGTKKSYTKFHVHLDDFSDDLIFYKSDRSNRWWLEVKYLAKDNAKYERHCLVPCNQEDYTKALENVIPNLWWKTLQKMS
ncbi:MAG: formimidoylglutamase [Crocinitomicaceae bacterium]|nr:formimidoylglutamase [Crocinitomicaceae bacterium]